MIGLAITLSFAVVVDGTKIVRLRGTANLVQCHERDYVKQPPKSALLTVCFIATAVAAHATRIFPATSFCQMRSGTALRLGRPSMRRRTAEQKGAVACCVPVASSTGSLRCQIARSCVPTLNVHADPWSRCGR